MPLPLRSLLLVLLLALAPPVLAGDTAPITPVECGPGGGGDPCDGSGPASQGNTSGTNQGAGNPINVITGNKYQREVDLPKLPGVLGLEIVRHYNGVHAGAPAGLLGRGWRLSYETDLHVLGRTLQIVQADGSRIIFTRDPRSPDLCATRDPARGRIRVTRTAQGEAYDWLWPGGRTLSFDARGRLMQIKAATGEFVSLTRDPAGLLVQVTDPQGRRLVLGYPGRGRAGFHGVAQIDSPAGRFGYAYGSPTGDTPRARLANLAAVSAPDGTRRHYRYDDPRHPALLTGLDLEAGGKTVRLASWAYDAEGRGILSLKGAPPEDGTAGLEQVSLDYGPGRTTLTNSLGQKTVYRHAIVGGEYRLLEVAGAGCANCGETNVRYRYDRLGRLVETVRLDARGRPLGVAGRDLDRLGRVVREWAKSRGTRRLLARYEYLGDTPWPSLVARPSVVAGREHTLRIAYNDAGQPVSVAETGYAPVPDGPPRALARTTTYAYVRVNGRSLLAQVDGPLPNGPKNEPSDSDITRYGWDGQGNRPVAIVHPGGFRRSLAYDELGRPVETVDDDGARRLATRRDYGRTPLALLAPERVSRTAWLLDRGQPVEASRQALTVARLRHDALGRPVETADAAGRIVRYAYDAAGRRIAVSDGRGYASKLELDSEGQLQRAGLYRPETPDRPWRAAYYWHDGYGRLTGRLRPDGDLDTWTYDAAGQVAEHLDGDEIRTRYLRRADRRARLSQTPDGWLRLATPTGPGDALTDDFGQILRRILPDHGVQTARYDPAGRIVDIRRADGSGVEYGYDAAGRLLRKTFIDGHGRHTDEVRLIYAGRLLAERRDSAQTSRYAYDALGRKTGETIRFAGQARDLAVAVRYDAATGLVRARTLADGRVLRIERTDPEAGATARSLRLQPAWAAAVQDWIGAHLAEGLGAAVGRWLPGQAIADDIAVDPYDGLTGYIAGNGLATRRRFDLAGRLTALDIQAVGRFDYGYGNGPRLREVRTDGTRRTYAYHGFGQLDRPPAALKADGAAPRRDALGRTLDDGRRRYTYTGQGQVETVTDKTTGRLVARYRYNGLGQRVMKTVYADGRETTTWTLWQDGLRVAEIDAGGHIRTQYLYLAEGSQATPIAELAGTAVYTIHADRRGEPIAMTDESRALVWRAEVDAWGRAEPAHGQGGPASLNLRLPGQYYDEETGLHDNGWRTYDPGTGRYLQPDPLGYPDGPDAYRYAGGDPVNRFDATGLYAEDVHYYLTYFLALVAGIDAKQAWIIATADQTIDVNPYTEAFPSLEAGGNKDARERYHFTQDGYDPKPEEGEVTYTVIPNPFGPPTVITTYSPAYQLRRLGAWNNPQIQVLHGYAVNAGELYGPCMKGQFYGEYLHALEDVFGHRQANNDPYGATTGHWTTDPDMTYNHGNWQLNEQRTLEMEKVVFNQLRSDFGREAYDKNGFPIEFSDIEGFLKEWNAIQEIGGIDKAPNKLEALNAELTQLFGKKTMIPDYKENIGLGCRLKYLGDAHLIKSDGGATRDARSKYKGAILDTSNEGATACSPPI